MGNWTASGGAAGYGYPAPAAPNAFAESPRSWGMPTQSCFPQPTPPPAPATYHVPQQYAALAPQPHPQPQSQPQPQPAHSTAAGLTWRVVSGQGLGVPAAEAAAAGMPAMHPLAAQSAAPALGLWAAGADTSAWDVQQSWASAAAAEGAGKPYAGVAAGDAVPISADAALDDACLRLLSGGGVGGDPLFELAANNEVCSPTELTHRKWTMQTAL